GSALAVSICVSDPRLTGSSASTTLRAIPLLATSNGSGQPSSGPRSPSLRQSLNSVRTLDQMVSQASIAPPDIHPVDGPVDPNAGSSGPGIGSIGGGGDSSGPGFGPGPAGDPPPAAVSPKRVSQPVEVQHPRDNHPMRVSPPVLQGKAIYRKSP